MKVSGRRLCLSFSEELSRKKVLPLFSFGAFLLPEAIIAANFPALKKKKKASTGAGLQFSWTLRKLSVKPTERSSPRTGKERETGLGCLKMPVCSLTAPPNPTPQKERELPARSHIKEYFLRSHRDGEWSCWVISAVNKWCQPWHFLAGRDRTPLR